MLQEIADLREEGDALYELLHGVDEEVWQMPTLFKHWTVHDVVLHLHFSDAMAVLTATDKPAFEALLSQIVGAIGEGKGLMQFSREWMGEISGPALFARWRERFLEMCDCLSKLDPKARLDWFGPDMGLRMFATARQMETWAHGQEIYDLLGVERINGDRIKNIVVLGIKTFGWSFQVRALEVPTTMPYVRLEAPSGTIWEWGEPSSEHKIEGKAEEFAQVVAQVRNIADTSLEVAGDVAARWMAVAQCFAGPPETPPAPGTRFRQPSKHP